MTKPPSIRPATDDDVEALVALSKRTITRSYASFLGEAAVAGYIQSGAVDRYVCDSIGQCVVIVRDQVVTGFSVTRQDLIDLMMVDAARHRQGLGSLLLCHVEEMLFARFDRLRLESFRDNAIANAFYRKHAWTAGPIARDEESGLHKIQFHKLRTG